MTMIVFGARLALGSALELLSPTTELVVTGSDVKSLIMACHNPIKRWFAIVA